MLWWNFSVLVLYLFGLSNGYNLTSNFEKIALPDRFIGSVQTYVENNKNTISDQCKVDLKEYIGALFPPKPWAWLMFDAGSKIRSGILSGNLVDLGQFDQCLKIENKISGGSTISGKYCLGSIALFTPGALESRHSVVLETPETKFINPAGAMAILFATCLPDSCSTSDIQSLYSSFGVKLDFFDSLCQSKSTQWKLTGGAIATITFLAIIFFIMLVSTAYDIILFYSNKKPLHSLLIAFSVLSNGKKLIATSNGSGQISCLSGIRVISMMWVILAHRYSLENFIPKRNYIDVLKWIHDERNMFAMGGTVAVDTFFVLGGLLVSYSFMTAMAKGVKFNIIMFYVHRYLRLTPILAVVVLIYVTILKHLGSGPLWQNAMSAQAVPCEKYWWSTLLYVQNYVNPESLCINQSWYLAVDTQLFFLSPIILLSLRKSPIIGISLTAVLLFGSILASFLVGWFNRLYGLITANNGSVEFMADYYMPTHTRAGPWLMGIMLGYYIYDLKQNRKKIPMNKVLAWAAWVIALTILCACVYTGHNTTELTYEYDRLANSFYLAFLRPGWAVGICWVILACVTGYGGPVNWFLSLPMFQVLARFTYSMYLIHNAVQAAVSWQVRTSSVFSDLDTLYLLSGDFLFTLAISTVLTLAFESPVLIIEKVLFGTGKETPPKSAPSLENGKKSEVS